MNFDLNSIAELGIDLTTGLGYTGGQERFISALQRYYKSSESNKERLREGLENGDMESLQILFHSLKSNSKMIGAVSLADKFQALETSAGNKDADAINEGVKEAIEEYEGILEALRPLGEMEPLRAEGELSAEEAKETVGKLLEALEDFSDDLASDLVSKLAGYPFRITQKEKLRQASELIKDFLYSDAEEIIREISSSIE